MQLTRILCPTDFSLGSQQAVRVAIRLAKLHGAELILAHSWSLPATAFPIEAPVSTVLVQRIFADAQRELDRVVAEAIAAGASRARAMLLGGPPWLQIVDSLERQHVDLCVIGTHGHTALARVVLGSVAEKVVRHAPCPVLVVRPGNDDAPFQHVLVPTDFSASARHAADLAAALVVPGGKLSLLHVLELPISFTGEIKDTDFARDLDKRSAQALDNEAARLRGLVDASVTGLSRIGYAGAQTLTAIDRDPSVDLVVMGSHGHTGIKRVLMGSVAEKVVRHARCPVLVARQSETSTATA